MRIYVTRGRLIFLPARTFPKQGENWADYILREERKPSQWLRGRENMGQLQLLPLLPPPPNKKKIDLVNRKEHSEFHK